MKFQWKLFPLQRKLDWDLELARNRLGTALAGSEEAEARLRSLEAQRAEQAARAAGKLRQQLGDPHVHAQAMAYLCAMEACIEQARAQRRRLQQELAEARAECLLCRQRADTVEHLHRQALAAHLQEERRADAKAADLAWLASMSARQGFPGACG